MSIKWKKARIDGVEIQLSGQLSHKQKEILLNTVKATYDDNYWKPSDSVN